MSAIDSRTVIALVSLMGALMSLVLFFMRRNYPASIKGIGEWSLTLLLLFAAGVLASMRDQAPDLVTVAVPNLLITAGTYLAFVGSQRFVNQPPRLLPNLVLIALVNLVLLWFTVVDSSYGSRTLVLTLALAYLFGIHAHLYARHGYGTFSDRFVVFILCLATLNELLRFVTAAAMPVGQNLFDPSWPNLLYITAYPFIMLLLAIGMVLLATHRLRVELEHLATHDSLTNATTRRHLNDSCEQELERCRRHGRSTALLLMDLDHFKAINDTRGHQAGDQVLIRFVDIVNGLLRRGDELGRFGGEEFVALLPETALPDALMVAERIRAACEADTVQLGCTVSIGVSSYQTSADTTDSLLARADAAMYRAKAAGRNRVEAG
ncbi:GGDEF domain-containing protein [Rhodoferax sp.]|uniref:GGDEF domain-containing protein n=1 Tax=Rhodoferax sp. TaxID=50421 RepID=UPI0027555CA8|nr:diguanylate cyclase [Rhodoferax sp.]